MVVLVNRSESLTVVSDQKKGLQHVLFMLFCCFLALWAPCFQSKGSNLSASGHQVALWVHQRPVVAVVDGVIHSFLLVLSHKLLTAALRKVSFKERKEIKKKKIPFLSAEQFDSTCSRGSFRRVS